MRRSVERSIAEASARAEVGDYRVGISSSTCDVEAEFTLSKLNIACPALARDIAALGKSFLAHFAVDRASLRVEVVDTQSCPKFHVDNVRMRMVTTYHGPATEYIRLDGPEVVLSAPMGALVFLKGLGHPTHSARVLHRSPALAAGQKRLCVVLDF